MTRTDRHRLHVVLPAETMEQLQALKATDLDPDGASYKREVIFAIQERYDRLVAEGYIVEEGDQPAEP